MCTVWRCPNCTNTMYTISIARMQPIMLMMIFCQEISYLFSRLARHWLEGGCGAPDWCVGFDFDQSSVVDLKDLAMYDSCCIEVVRE